ncbi:hypothetical protein PR202_ga24630 [Eleusine coracana subsp. coracana]|uniref:Disease resistance R13L4/SHOC-2-like LRR domain-containing protein n=1 Tax=Eleusine coracana subsp. coracana TaxID=191504 RepID=A0AAV5D9D5_ELECO|nr:hypothetical protein PR202_ga24630 [Eleusine coracana subsp. coracana]
MEGYSLESIGNIPQLRYLGLTYTPTSELPEEIGRLNFLETLNLEKTGTKELPESMSQHTQLMCLFADKNTSATLDWKSDVHATVGDVPW